jgi:hypothetical protein
VVATKNTKFPSSPEVPSPNFTLSPPSRGPAHRTPSRVIRYLPWYSRTLELTFAESLYVGVTLAEYSRSRWSNAYRVLVATLELTFAECSISSRQFRESLPSPRFPRFPTTSRSPQPPRDRRTRPLYPTFLCRFPVIRKVRVSHLEPTPDGPSVPCCPGSSQPFPPGRANTGLLSETLNGLSHTSTTRPKPSLR